MAKSDQNIPQYRIAIAQTRAARNLVEWREAILRSHGLTSPEWLVLGFVGSTTKSGGVKVSQIASELDVQSTYVTGILRKLEAKELISLRAGQTDRRVRMITATKKGSTLYKTLDKELANQRQQWLDKTSDSAFRNYLNVLEVFSKGYTQQR